MKFSYVHFLARANIKGSKKSGTVFVMMLILILSLTLISSFSVTVTGAVNEYREDYRARLVSIDPFTKRLDDEVIAGVKKIDHVENVFIQNDMRSMGYDIIAISDENGECEEYKKRLDEERCIIEACTLIGDEKRDVIAGKRLDESPMYSCIIPSMFYPYEYGNNNTNLDYIDGTTLIGKTFTLKPFLDSFEIMCNYDGMSPELDGSKHFLLPPLEIKLKVVGVYYSSPTAAGYFSDIFISKETGEDITLRELKAGNVDLEENKSMLAQWWNTPRLHTHYVLVDDYENLDYVYTKLGEMNIFNWNEPTLGIKKSTENISAILSVVGVILIIASAILCIINIIQSTTTMLISRKGEIGLLKAVGYKDRQIFACLYCEQLIQTIKGCALGAVISAAVIFAANLFFNHSTYVNRLYVVDWSNWLFFLIISVIIAVLVPLICELIMLYRLRKIQPKDAMNSN